ncbi:MAG TPA: hypothetical protein VF427_03025 [Noviherbaspirillum sp.]
MRPRPRKGRPSARALRIGLLEGGCNILAPLSLDADLEKQIAQLQPDVTRVLRHQLLQLVSLQ